MTTQHAATQPEIASSYPSLHESIQQLINTFGEMEGLIHRQLQAVVENNFEEIVEHAEQQLDMTDLLNHHEQQFQRVLGLAFEEMNVDASPPTLSSLLKQVGQLREEFEPLRDQLLAAISRTQKAQSQLIKLLEFAQDHVSHTLREIYALSNQHAMHYTHNGHTTQGAGLVRMINQTV